MDTAALKKCIENDLEKGYKPLCVVAALGTTGSTAVDPLPQIAEIIKPYGIWLHVDAAYAGSALILSEYRWMLDGIDSADSFVFNPHKWLFTNFDCSAYFVADREALIHTFEMVPEYLRSQVHEHANDYSNWGIQLGRRFRALKLWFVIRMFGIEGLQQKLRSHIRLAEELERRLVATGRFEILSPRLFNLICFRLKPAGYYTEDQINRMNEVLLQAVNKTGKIYITHTRLNGKYALRMVIAQTHTCEVHVDEAFSILLAESAVLIQSQK
jgi:aromatic-L-amino-acid decarboxylase